jgi:RNA polymerase sigma-70 factor, ECF subfamily
MRNIKKERFVATNVRMAFEDGVLHPIEKVKPMPDQAETCLSGVILTEISHLRAYARLMTDDLVSADREVTETLKRALSNSEALRKPTGLRVHLLTTLRNFLIDSEQAPRKFKGLSATYERLNGPFRSANGGHGQRPMSLASALLYLNFENREAVVLRAGVRLSREEAAKVIGCELHVYDARIRCGFARLAELLPAETPVNPSSEAICSRAFSGLNKALELQEMLAQS